MNKELRIDWQWVLAFLVVTQRAGCSWTTYLVNPVILKILMLTIEKIAGAVISQDRLVIVGK